MALSLPCRNLRGTEGGGIATEGGNATEATEGGNAMDGSGKEIDEQRTARQTWYNPWSQKLPVFTAAEVTDASMRVPA